MKAHVEADGVGLGDQVAGENDVDTRKRGREPLELHGRLDAGRGHKARANVEDHLDISKDHLDSKVGVLKSCGGLGEPRADVPDEVCKGHVVRLGHDQVGLKAPLERVRVRVARHIEDQHVAAAVAGECAVPPRGARPAGGPPRAVPT